MVQRPTCPTATFRRHREPTIRNLRIVQLAGQHARAQFEKYDAERRPIEAAQPTSDFDMAVEETKRLAAETPSREAKRRRSRKGGTNA